MYNKRMLQLCSKSEVLECGVDEVGRGALAGPVVAAAVIWHCEYDDDWEWFIHDIKDSKLLSSVKRKQLADAIKDHSIDWSVSFVDNKTIDNKNILQATYDAMHHAIDHLQVPVDHILVDGNRFREYQNVPHTCVVKGDNTYLSIAAASILAKVARDEFMTELSKQPEYRHYQWEKNLGYGTKAHMDAIANHGPSTYHRMSFRLGI